MKHFAESPMQRAVAIFCALLLPASVSLAQAPIGNPSAAPQTASQEGAPLLPPEELNNLVAPIALYPDPLLGQVLAASTYPLEIAATASIPHKTIAPDLRIGSILTLHQA